MRFASYSTLLFIAIQLMARWVINAHYGTNLLSTYEPASYSCQYHCLKTNLSSTTPSATSPSLYQKPSTKTDCHLEPTCPTSDTRLDLHLGTSHAQDPRSDLKKSSVNKFPITKPANFKSKDQNQGHNLTEATFEKALRPNTNQPTLTTMSAFSYFASPPPDNRPDDDSPGEETNANDLLDDISEREEVDEFADEERNDEEEGGPPLTGDTQHGNNEPSAIQKLLGRLNREEQNELITIVLRELGADATKTNETETEDKGGVRM